MESVIEAAAATRVQAAAASAGARVGQSATLNPYKDTRIGEAGEQPAAAQGASASARVPSAAVPPGWEHVWDDSEKCHYWVAPGATVGQWEPPTTAQVKEAQEAHYQRQIDAKQGAQAASVSQSSNTAMETNKLASKLQ